MEEHVAYRKKRNQLVSNLSERGISDEKVLEAIQEIPRHFFVPEDLRQFAYEDKPLPIGLQQTISQPYTVAFQTELLQLSYKDKVLEVGTGSGYQTAILAYLSGEVFTMERLETLQRFAQNILSTLFNFGNIHFLPGDGHFGAPLHAPFDKILVTAGAAEVPEALKQQLKIGGKLVIPVGIKQQQMLRITKIDDGNFLTEDFGTFSFVPMIKD